MLDEIKLPSRNGTSRFYTPLPPGSLLEAFRRTVGFVVIVFQSLAFGARVN
jgi:hypothetical protein